MPPLTELANGRAPRSAAEGPTHQALKSAATRARLIAATIQCLVNHGYANLTTREVASVAGLSRGAMLHHFENGTALIRATIVELHERRLRAFRRAAEADDRHGGAMIDTYWSQLQKPAFVAFNELVMAARTDAELAHILRPLQREFRERFEALAGQLYPEWQAAPERFALAMHLSQTMMEGMATGLMVGTLDSAMVEPLLHHLRGQVEELRPSLMNQPR